MEIDLIHSRSQSIGNRPALWFNGRQLTYGDLERRACQMANRLRERGVRRGDRVSIVSVNHVAHIDLMLAAPKLGYQFAPVSAAETPADIRSRLEQLEPAVVFADSRNAPLAEAAGRPWTRLSEYGEWLAVGDPSPSEPPGLGPDDVHMIMYDETRDGSGAAHEMPYRQTWGNAAATALEWDLGDKERLIHSTGCASVLLNVLVVPVLWANGFIALMARFEPQEYFNLLQRFRPSVLCLTPVQMRLLASSAAFENSPVNSARFVVVVGARCSRDVAERFRRRGLAVRHVHSLAEIGPNLLTLSEDGGEPGHEIRGRPLVGFDVELHTREGEVVAGVGEGEIVARGAAMSRGYWRAADTVNTVFRDGWVHTGEIARRAADGSLQLCGRVEELFVANDQLLNPYEVEVALLQCPGVLECKVFGARVGAHADSVGVAVAVADPRERATEMGLLNELRSRLPHAKVPERIILLEALPKRETGRIDVAACRRLVEDRLGQGGTASPR